MITELRHAGIVVADLEQSLSFWCDTLGFFVVKKMEEKSPFIDVLLGLKNVRVTTCKISAPDGTLVELLYFRSHPDKKSWDGLVYSTGLTHLAFTVDNIDAEFERLTKAGVNFFSLPQISPDGGVKVAYASGPEKILLEFVQILESPIGDPYPPRH